ncbi:phage baseplate protein [Corticimicrobacter populi]|uniref:phage baseplate protein n=1 Tax=Corticimicrobacter populi TaxID=2175229 RepID=UPI001EFD6E36|nr:hypothetical protein [Corticimicrobacter populi]
MIALKDSLSTSTQQSVAILDADTLQPIFQSAHPMRLSVRESKRATKFAVEDGSERSDHVVRELTEVQVDLLLNDDTRNQFDALRQAYQQNTLVTVQTKVASYENLLILDLPHDETAELGAAVSVPVRFQEWLEVRPEYGTLPPAKVENKGQSSTVARGQQTSSDADSGTQRKGSVLSGVFR